MIESMFRNLELNEITANIYPPLDLAYIGDCVYELAIRTTLISKGATSVEKLNKRANNLAKAVTQAKIIVNILDKLSEEEIAVYKRGRNAKVNTPAKSATLSEYHKATGFEALIGWLYLRKEFDRMFEIIRLGWESLTEEDSNG